MRNNETGLFPAIEAALKAASEPMDAQALFDMAPIREHAASVNRVSDYLGNMWRKNLVTRLPAPKMTGSRSRWTYEWRGQKGPKVYGTEYTPNILLDRPTLLVTEEGTTITLEFSNLVIVVKQKPAK